MATTATPCEHRPDFYPSIMRWQCTRCGAFLTMEGGLFAAWNEAVAGKPRKARSETLDEQRG
jgi:hypothetical protein